VAEELNLQISFMTALTLMEIRNKDFMAALLATLNSTRFKAFYFETPCMTEAKVL